MPRTHAQLLCFLLRVQEAKETYLFIDCCKHEKIYTWNILQIELIAFPRWRTGAPCFPKGSKANKQEFTFTHFLISDQSSDSPHTFINAIHMHECNGCVLMCVYHSTFLIFLFLCVLFLFLFRRFRWWTVWLVLFFASTTWALQCDLQGTKYDCSYRGLTQVPTDIPSDVTEL